MKQWELLLHPRNSPNLLRDHPLPMTAICGKSCGRVLWDSHVADWHFFLGNGLIMHEFTYLGKTKKKKKVCWEAFWHLFESCPGNNQISNVCPALPLFSFRCQFLISLEIRTVLLWLPHDSIVQNRSLALTVLWYVKLQAVWSHRTALLSF